MLVKCSRIKTSVVRAVSPTAGSEPLDRPSQTCFCSWVFCFSSSNSLSLSLSSICAVIKSRPVIASWTVGFLFLQTQTEQTCCPRWTGPGSAELRIRFGGELTDKPSGRWSSWKTCLLCFPSASRCYFFSPVNVIPFYSKLSRAFSSFLW